MSNNIQFPARPRPFNRESFKGYVLRLASVNGRGSIREMAKTINYKIKPQCLVVGTTNYIAFTDVLAPTIEISAEKLRAYFSPTAPVLTNGYSSIENIAFSSPRICVACCQAEETKYMKTDWLPAHHTHCEVHKTPLLDCCPSCDHVFDWHSDVFDGCPHCGLRWEDYCSLPQDIPVYQSTCNDIPDHELTKYLNQLYNWLQLSVRPFDSMVHQHGCFPVAVKNIRFNFAQAHSLLTDESFRAEWHIAKLNTLKHRIDKCLLSRSQLDQFTHISSKILDVTVSKKLPCQEQANFLPRKLIDLVLPPKDLRLLITIEQAAKLLRLEIKTTQKLALHGSLKSSSIPHALQNKLINLQTINSFLTKFMDKTTMKKVTDVSKKQLHFKSACKGLKYFNCDEADLVEFIMNDDVEVYRQVEKTEFSIMDVYINESQLASRLDDFFLPSLTDYISQSRVKEMCGLNSKQFTELKSVCGIKVIKTQSNFYCISHHSLKKLFSEYVLLNRWSKINNVDYSDVRKYVKHQLVNAESFSLDYLNVTLIPNTEELNLILNRYLDYLNGEHHKLALICK